MAIARGDGSQNNPFVLIIPSDVAKLFPSLPAMAAAVGYPSAIQTAFVNGTFGEGKWELIGRTYFQSPLGNPGNGDLCRWQVRVNGQERSLWFDLSNASLVHANPHLLANNPPFSSFPTANAAPKQSWKFWK